MSFTPCVWHVVSQLTSNHSSYSSRWECCWWKFSKSRLPVRRERLLKTQDPTRRLSCQSVLSPEVSCQREGWALTAEERRILAKSCWIRALLGKVCHGTRFSVTHVADVVARNVEVAPGHLVC